MLFSRPCDRPQGTPPRQSRPGRQQAPSYWLSTIQRVLQNTPPEPPGSSPGAIGALTRDPWRSPIDPSVGAPSGDCQYSFWLNHYRLGAARRHGNCQRDQPGPTFSASASSELVGSIGPTMADRLSRCRNLCGLRGGLAGEAWRQDGPLRDRLKSPWRQSRRVRSRQDAVSFSTGRPILARRGLRCQQ